MPLFTVGHAYSAFRDGARIGPWEAGEQVEVDVELASFVNVDSPGALVAVRDKPEAKPNRQHSGAKSRA